MFPWGQRGARPLSPGAAGAVVCGAIALWVSFGALSFVDADNNAPYVGILPSPLWLAALLVAAALFVVAYRPSAQVVAPLWLSAVAILPWLPVPVPLSAFIWSGPILLWLWTAIVVAMLLSLPRFIVGSGQPWVSALLAGSIAAVLFGAGTWSVAPAHPDGDEPHYLVITQSLLRDHDIKIENNHVRGDYQAYLDRSIKPDFLKRSTDGQIYSIHAPGLSAIVAPGFAALGYAGVLIELVLISAAASALLWLVAWRVTWDLTASWFGWAVFTLTVPFFFHASAIFPDGLGAVLTLPALLPLVDARARQPRPLFAVGSALAVLPWLNSRFVLLACMAAIVIVGRLVTDRSKLTARVAAFSIVPALSAVLFFLFFQVIYGTPNPSVVYGGVPSMSTTPATLVRGVPGLFFDQQFGLIPNAPVYLCAFAGLVLMARLGSGRLALELTLIATPYFLVAASFTSWWGGTTAPARYFVPITPLLAVPAAFWYANVKSRAMKVAGLGALLVSMLMTATFALVDRGAFVINFRDGMSRVARWLSPAVDLTRALPSLFQNPPGLVLLQSAIWLAAIAVAIAVAVYAGRRKGSGVFSTTSSEKTPDPFSVATMVAFGLALEMMSMAAVSLVWKTNGALVAMPGTGGSALLRKIKPGASQVGVSYRPFRLVEPADLSGRVTLARALVANTKPETVSVARLPAGTYEVQGTMTGVAAGHVRLRTDRVSGPLADWDMSGVIETWKREVTLPIGVSSLQFEADPAVRSAMRDVSIHALSVARPEAGFENREARRGVRLGPVSLFLMDGSAWVEPSGVWVSAGSEVEFAVAVDQPAPVQLFVRNGPVENTVSLESGSWREPLTLRPGEERLLQLPIDANRKMTPLRVQASRGFRPSDVDRNSEDRRLLGVWIETR